MENLAMQIIDEVVEREGFVIDTDAKAEWALNKLREEKAEVSRIEMVCQNMIEMYQAKIKRVQEQHDTRTSYLKSQLQQYFETVPHKATKTQETYQLPSGRLKRKFGGLDYIRDETVLLEWVKANGGQEDFVQVKESVKWAELKKTITVKGNDAIDCDGEVIPGIKVETKPDKFEIEL